MSRESKSLDSFNFPVLFVSEESVKYARLLRSLGRVSQLESYYHKCEMGQLGTAWRGGVEGSHLGGPPTWLTTFYDRIALLSSQQVNNKNFLLEVEC